MTEALDAQSDGLADSDHEKNLLVKWMVYAQGNVHMYHAGSDKPGFLVIIAILLLFGGIINFMISYLNDSQKGTGTNKADYFLLCDDFL